VGNGDVGVRHFLETAMLVFAIPFMGWTLVRGLQTGIMDVGGVLVATYSRARQPFMFWLAAFSNAMICIGSFVLLITDV